MSLITARCQLADLTNGRDTMRASVEGGDDFEEAKISDDKA
jgi:hypothetical protein